MINTWGKSCGHRDNGGIDLVEREVTWRHGSLRRKAEHFGRLKRVNRSPVWDGLCAAQWAGRERGGRAGSKHSPDKGIGCRSFGEGSARARPLWGHRQRVSVDGMGVDSDT